jgi:predicted flap endonuclease-1-like 5' DNA nuclease
MKVKANYRYSNQSHGLAYEEGAVFEASPDLWTFLQADAPEVFTAVDGKKAPSKPAAHKAVLEADNVKAPLSVITGISASRQVTLNKIGILTMADLAAADAAELARLKGVSVRMAERWIREAGRRSGG